MNKRTVKSHFLTFSNSLMIFTTLTSLGVANEREKEPDSPKISLLSRFKERAVAAPVDLNALTEAQGFSIQGAIAGDQSGYSVSAAGDINGDGFTDLVIGAFQAGPQARTNAGTSYVVYGKSGGYGVPVDLNALTAAQGFTIQGAAAGDASGYSVSAAGDINGDSLADLVIGAFGASPQGRGTAGASYVVYGKSGGYGVPVDLNALTAAQGFTIQGAAAGDASGYSVSAAGDINGDGLADLVIGAFGAGPQARNTSGASYVVYGKSGGYGVPIDLNALTAAQGFTIQGAAAGDQSGRSVSTAGDINGDGLADLVIGAPNASPQNRTNAGASYVVYGKSGGYGVPIDLNALTAAQGFTIQGAVAGDSYRLGTVSAAGDINGDGHADLVIGAPNASPQARTNAGVSYVVYGKSGGYGVPVDLNALTEAQGFSIQGAIAGDNSGISVSAAGDINDDSHADLVIGAPNASPQGRRGAGASYVVYGKSGGYGVPVDLNALTAAQGFTIQGAIADDFSGCSVSAAGDINGDGHADLVIGAFGASPQGRRAAGASYVVYGLNPSSSLSPSVAPSVSSGERPAAAWYSPAKWMSALKSIWKEEDMGQEEVAYTNPHAQALSAFKNEVENLHGNAHQIDDKWYGFKLEDMIEDMSQSLKRPGDVRKGALANYRVRLEEIKKDYVFKADKQPSRRLILKKTDNPIGRAIELNALQVANSYSLGSGMTPLSLGK